MTDPLREALAEALHEAGINGAFADTLLAHPAVIAARSGPAGLREALDNLPQWAMVGPLNNRHMEAVRPGQYWAIVDVRAAVAAHDRSGPADSRYERDATDYGWDVVRSEDYMEGYDAAVRRYVGSGPAEGLREVAADVAAELRSHFDGGKGVCVKDGEPMPCAALQSEATATGEGS